MPETEREQYWRELYQHEWRTARKMIQLASVLLALICISSIVVQKWVSPGGEEIVLIHEFLAWPGALIGAFFAWFISLVLIEEAEDA